MSTGGVTGTNNTSYMTQAAAKAAEAAKKTDNTKDAAVKEQADSFIKSKPGTTKPYKYDAETIKNVKEAVENQTLALRKMVESLLTGQGKKYNDILQEIQDMTPEQAASAIAEDGEWGVEAVSERILDFAKAISGGDSSKIEMLRGAIQKGFDAAERAWGGKLPDISQQTYDAVMKGLDEWESGAAETE